MSQRPAAGPLPFVGILGAILGASLLLPPGPAGALAARAPVVSNQAQGGGGDLGTPTSTPTPSPTVPAVSARIREVQGAAHRSPLTGTPVTGVPGIVIARRSNGFYIQDPQPDSSDSTSEGVFVFTSSVPTVAIGDVVRVDGQVQEFRPGCTPSCSPSSSDFDNLSITQIATGGDGANVRLVSSGNPTPTPIVLGAGGRRPPTQVIADDAPGDVENGGLFDPGSDGIDYYESLEGMLVQVNDAVVTGPRRSTGEIPVVGDDGDGAGQRTTRGGVVVRAGDFNPERIFLDDLFTTTPNVDVADRFPGAITGVMDYSFGNYKLQALALPPLQPAALPRQAAVPAAPDELAVATFNVENLDAADPPARFAGLASLIVNGLQSPDILALEEVQDDNGPTNDALVDATQTYARLIQAIKDAGGPAYEVRQVNPRDDQDGGQPGGNIRVALLFRFDRGLCFVDRPGAGPDSATIPVLGPEGLQLTYSPGRIEPTNAVWSNSRKPLAGEFRYNGQTLFVIANHFNSKGGDDPLFGRFQPPVLNTEAQRREQAQVERDFISALLALDPQARVVALGDLNDFEFSPPLGILKGTDMTALVETLPPGERYTYVFDGNSQALDHTLVSPALLAQVVAYDILHLNAEYVQRESDHDPQVTRFRLSGTPTSPGGASCGPAGPPSPTPTGAPGTATPTATATVAPSATATATPSSTLVPTSSATATAVPTATPFPTPTPSAGGVGVVGAGIVDAGNGSASFALSVRRRSGGAIAGTLLYRAPQSGQTVRSDSITSFEVSGNEATLSGTCTDLTRNAPCMFSAVATEGQRPGQGGSFSLQVDDAPAEGGPVRAGVVRISD